MVGESHVFTRYVFAADGSHQAEWTSMGIDHHWLRLWLQQGRPVGAVAGAPTKGYPTVRRAAEGRVLERALRRPGAGRPGLDPSLATSTGARPAADEDVGTTRAAGPSRWRNRRTVQA